MVKKITEQKNAQLGESIQSDLQSVSKSTIESMLDKIDQAYVHKMGIDKIGEGTPTAFNLGNKYQLDKKIAADYGTMLNLVSKYIENNFNIRGEFRDLVIEDLKIDAPKHYPDYKGQVQAKHANATWGMPIKVKFALKDKAGKVLDRSGWKTILNIPLLTGRGTYIVDGQEYAIRRQLRLLPGVYTAKTAEGVGAFINTGARQNIKMNFSPDTLKFGVEIGTRNFSLYPVLSALGVPDDAMRKVWGEKVFVANSERGAHLLESTMDRLFKTLYAYGEASTSYPDKVQMVLDAFEQSSLDEWSTKTTLGTSHENITPGMFIDITKKMLGVSNGTMKEDSRDALYFRSLYGIDNMIDFALNKYQGELEKKLLLRLDNPDRDDINYIVSRPIATINKAVLQRFNQHDLAFLPLQSNPLDAFNTLTEVTLMGEGGISSEHSIPITSRALDDSNVGMLGPLQTPTSGRVGANTHLTMGADKMGSDIMGVISPIDSHETYHVSARDQYDEYIALPGEFKKTPKGWKPKKAKSLAVHKGKITKVLSSKIENVIPNHSNMFTWSSNVIPFLNHDAPTRMSMGTSQMAHLVKLKNPERALVQSVIDYDGKKPITADEYYYKEMNIRAPLRGVVQRVEADNIVIKSTKDGKLHKIPYYRDFPLNTTRMLNTTPIVKKGDRVREGDVIAENGFSMNGNLATGLNLHIAYMPWKGMNFQDGLVISDSASDKLTSLHTYQEEYSNNPKDVYSKSKFIAHYPNLFTSTQLGKVDKDGVIKEGMTVDKGDPLALKISPRKLTEDDILRGQISTVFRSPMARDEKLWNHENRGVVHKVIKGNGYVKVYIKTEEKLRQGDKLTGKHGQKGVVVSVLPDDEMPRTQNGDIIDIIQNPAAVPSRMNLGQILETSAGKLAHHTGQIYKVDNFNDGITPEVLSKQLKSAGMSDQDMLYDKDGNEIGNVFTGRQYFFKLRQQAEKYYRARNHNDPYDIISHRPIKGPKMGPLGFYAMLAHGATKNLKEFAGFKSEHNDDWWRAYETGAALPRPQTTFAFDKLSSFLKGAGVNVRQEKDSLRLLPLTDNDVDNMSGGEVADPSQAVKIGNPNKADFLQPIPGGLYDRKLFGGLMGEKWGHMTLAEPLPNPIFERPIQILLNLTQRQYTRIVDGRDGVLNGEIVEMGPETRPKAITGGLGIKALLSQIKVKSALEEQIDISKHTRGDKRDKAMKKIGYLNGLRLAGMKPEDYVITKIPVLPPQFRPVYMTERGDLRVSDLTAHYHDLGRVNNQMKDMRGLPQEVTGNLRDDLYDAVKALQGIGEPNNYGRARGAYGILKFMKGDIPAKGHYQDKIFSKRQSIGGRAVIMVDPELSIDDVGIPEEMAWSVFKPFVMRRLAIAGIRPLDADKMLRERHPRASDALDAEMAYRPVILSRDPKLHKFNYLAFNAHRIKDEAIHIPPLITKGFNADFDGDAMSVLVPVMPDAVEEAKSRMMASQNLIKYGKDTVVMVPEEDAIGGLYAGTAIKKDKGIAYASPQDALAAFKRKDIDITDGIFVSNKKTTAGRVMFNEILPQEYRDYSTHWGDSEVRAMLNKVAREKPNEYAPIAQGVKDLGDFMAYKLALSFSLKDFFSLNTSDLTSIKLNVEKLNRISNAGEGDRVGDVSYIPKGFDEKLTAKLKAKTKDSTLGMFAESGAKGGWGNIKQMLYSPVLMADIRGGVLPHVIKDGFAHGMDLGDYWTAAKGSRASIYASQLGVQDPGFFTKQLLRATLGGTIAPGDYNTGKGIEYPIDHPTVLNRYLAKSLRDKNGNLLADANDPVTQELVEAAKKRGVEMITVRSPLTSVAPQGMYAKDFGRLPDGQKPRIGMDAGVISAHTLTEPATQLALRSFHSAGAVGQSKNVKGLYSLWPLLNGRTPTGAKAVMATKAGKIEKIHGLKTGGSDITMEDGTVYKATPDLKLHVKTGDTVIEGQALQDGFMDPKEVLRHQGMPALQRYLVDQIEDNYGNNSPDRRYLETLVASLTKYSKVTNVGNSSGLLPGDIIPTTQLEQMNANMKDKQDRIKAQPIFTGMDMFLPKVESDWAVKMMGRDMIGQIRESAATGAQSYLRGPKPILPFITGVDFGSRIDDLGVY